MKGVIEEDRFSYDAVGNRLTDIQNRSYTYNNGNELLTQNGTSFSYDANGNMVSKTDAAGATRYTYNTENQLIRVELPDGRVVEYKYDPFGRRIEKVITDTATGTVTTTRYVYDREDIIFELDANGNIVTEYLHGPGIDEPIAMIRNNQTYYYHADGLGSIIAITDSIGNVVQRYEYDSFGNITYQLDSNFKQPYTYTGREYDEETGLYYYRARYYDAKVGRFLQQDPFRGYLRKPQTQNRYIYVGNNPIKYVDPTGLITWEWWAEQIITETASWLIEDMFFKDDGLEEGGKEEDIRLKSIKHQNYRQCLSNCPGDENSCGDIDAACMGKCIEEHL